MATKVISVLLASDTQPGTVPAIPAVGKWLTAVLDGEGVLRPSWDDAPEAELTIPGDPGAVLYSGGLDTLAAANGLIVIDSGNGLQGAHFDGGGTVASDGTFRVANNIGGYVARRTDGGTVLVGGYIDGANGMLYGRTTGPYVAAANVAWYVDSAGAFYWRSADTETDWMALSAAGLSLLNRDLDGIDEILNINKIKGATVVPPVEGAAITTTATINVSQGNQRPISSAGGAYAITVHASTGSPYAGEGITFHCLTALANAITITNGGPGAGNIGFSGGTVPAGFKGSFSIYFDGTDWALSLGSVYRTP